MASRAWTLDSARAMLPEVRRRTERAVADAEALLRERERAGASARSALERRIQEVVSRWTREMEALGVEVKGPWLVDFDSGAGYYCWRWPEEELAWFHGYDEGFAGRTRIQ